jgi:hypothetical protein
VRHRSAARRFCNHERDVVRAQEINECGIKKALVAYLDRMARRAFLPVTRRVRPFIHAERLRVMARAASVSWGSSSKKGSMRAGPYLKWAENCQRMGPHSSRRLKPPDAKKFARLFDSA